MKKKITLFLALVLACFMLFTSVSKAPVYGDVGDFESYSSWDSGSSSDYSSSSWSSSSDYDSDGEGSWVGFVIVIIIIIIIIYGSKNGNGGDGSGPHVTINNNNGTVDAPSNLDEGSIESKVKEGDENFNADEFKSWARDLFTKLQYAWSDRDWSSIRVFETNELFEQHSTQLERYKTNKQINKIERVCVNYVKLFKFEQSGDKDVLSVLLNSKMTDYIIDETTGRVLRGDRNTDRITTYKLTFIRKTGVKTKVGETTVNTTNCPNCGAPTEITSAGKCPYCGSVITTGEYNWVLSNLEPYRG